MTVDDIQIAMKLDVTRTDESVVEAVDLVVSHMWARAHRILDPGVVTEDPHPAVTVVHGKRLRRALHRGQQVLPVRRRHHVLSTNAMLAVRISVRACSVESAATPAVRSSSTRVARPARAASSAVRRTQWSVATPTTSTSSTPRCRNQSSSEVPFSSAPSKPLYAAESAPLRNTASIGAVSRSRWKSAPGLPARQCGGHEDEKSG